MSLFAELTATCNALGYAVAGKTKYLLDDECKEAVRELIRFLRRDDETHEIRRYLGSAKILEKDLVPILIHRRSNEEILDLLLRLLVNLTTPTLLLYNEEVPSERTARQYYQSIVQSLQTYKQAFADKNLWTVLSEKLTSLLALEWSDRGEEKSLIIVRILILVRNILHVPVDTDTERRPDNDASVHDQILWALHEGGMINLILYIAASENEQQYYFHILEIISLMLRDQNAETLANSSVQRSDEEKQRDLQELMAVRAKEVEDRQKKMKKHIAARHSRFGGTFVVKGVKSISDNDLVVHSLNNQITSSFDTKKPKLKTPKNRAPMQCDVVERRSAFSVRVLMKEFCIEFLNGAYNGLMRYIREMFARGKAQSNDESYYFWTMRFFMQFNRFYKFEVKLISETMSIQIFHFIQERLEDWRANLIIDKKKIHLWSKRMHLGLKAYQELLNTLMKMYNSRDKSVRDSSHTIMSNIFYIVEYRELLMSLLNLFDEIKFSKEYLKDLIESNHVFMKMLEHYCKRHRALVVQNKPKTVRRKKKPKKSAKQTKDLTAECTEEKWNETESKISDIVEQRGDELTVQSSPFDAASDVPFEEQKVEAVRRIRLFLVRGDTEEAIGLFRACREVWPENDCFGSTNMSSAEERAALKEIFFTDIGFPTDAAVVNEPSEEESESESDNEEAMAMNIQVSEQSFQFEDFVKKFAKQKIVYACCLLLGQFEKNTPFTNHCVLKLLHRIAFDCKYAAILFQASVFRTFQRILDSTEEQHKELKKFAAFIIRKFVEIAKKNDKVYMELLFWKGHKEAYEIEEGYGSLASAKSGKVAWTEEQEDELRRLFAEYEDEKPEQDMVDWIHRNIIDQSRSRKSLMKKLRELYLIVGPQKRKSSSSRPPREFSEAEVAQITQLFNEFREAYDVIGCIMERLDLQRPKKRIVDKILELGLIQDRRELRKKKVTSNSRFEDGSDSSNSSSDDDDDDEHAHRNVTKEVENSTHCLVSSEVASSMKTVLNSGMKEALEWIESSLNEVLEDLSEDEDDVPILPLADYSVKAMDNDDFRNFLKSIGIKPPADSQEMYWRIPGSWQANDIRKRVYLMRMVFDGKEIEENDQNANDNSQLNSDTENDMGLESDRTTSSQGRTDSIDFSLDLKISHGSAHQTPASKLVSLNDNEHVSVKKRKRVNVEEFRNISKEQKTKKKKKSTRIVNDADDDKNNLDASVVEESSGGSKKKVKRRYIQKVTNDDDYCDDLLSRSHYFIDETSSDDEINVCPLQKSKKKAKQMAANNVANADEQTIHNVSDVPSNMQIVNDNYEDRDKTEVIDNGKSSNNESKVDSQQKIKKKRIMRIVDDDESDNDCRNDDITDRVPSSVEINGGSFGEKFSLLSDDDTDAENVTVKKKKRVDLADSENSDAEMLCNHITKSYGLDSESD